MPRGEVGFVFAQVGFSAGLVSSTQLAALSLALVGTTLAGPLLLRATWRQE